MSQRHPTPLMQDAVTTRSIVLLGIAVSLTYISSVQTQTTNSIVYPYETPSSCQASEFYDIAALTCSSCAAVRAVSLRPHSVGSGTLAAKLQHSSAKLTGIGLELMQALGMCYI